MNNQFPTLKARYAREFQRHYIGSTWLELLKPVHAQSPPITPKAANIEEIKLSPPPREVLEVMEIKPKKAFLRRG